MLLGPEGSPVGGFSGPGRWLLVPCGGWVVAGVGLLFEFCIVDASIFVAIVCM
jgi:hypothetical protein